MPRTLDKYSVETMSTTYRTHIMLLNFIKSWFTQATYSSELERYITNHNPQNGGDIERLTKQFDTQLSQGRTL